MTLRKTFAAIFAAAMTVLLALGLVLLGGSGIETRASSANDAFSIEKLEIDNAFLRDGYMERYGVPGSKFDYSNNGGAEAGAPLSNAFDRNFGSIWRSQMSTTATDINYVEVKFHDAVTLDRIYYQADCGWYNRGSFTRVRISYIPETASDATMSEKDYVALPELAYPQTSDINPNLITFHDPIIVKAVKLEWLAVHTGHRACAAASEIVFLQPESDAVEAVQNLFTDYAQLHLHETIDGKRVDKAYIESLRNSVKGYATYDTELTYLLNRAEQVLAGTVSYDARREMGTDETSANVLQRRGDVAGYARSTLKMAWFGTNRQATGVSVAPGEELIVYVDGKEGDPLPRLVVTQFWGAWSSWKSGEYTLSLGKNIIRPANYLLQGFTTNDGQALPAGGPVYLVNPYVSPKIAVGRSEKVQSDDVKVYFEGGTLIPVFRKGGDVGLYRQRVAEYAEAVQKDRKEADAINSDFSSMQAHRDYKVVDVTEIVSDNINITVRATAANTYYNELGYSPQDACENWDTYVKELLRSDGVILEENDPNIKTYGGRYDPRAQWLNCNIRLMQPYGAAYAYTEHVGIQVSWEGGALTGLSFGWGYTHELGHMMDIGERTVSECSNNMLSKYDETVMSKIATRGDFTKTTEALAPDVHADSYWNTNRGNFIIWWLIESFENGWWPRLENLYRYYNIYEKHLNDKGQSTIGTLTATEKQVLLASISVGYDLSYYFERWGYNLSASDPVFKSATASKAFHTLMDEAVRDKKIAKDGYMPKIWYLDAAEWWARHDDATTATKIYGGTDVAEIEALTKSAAGYNMILRSDKMNDPSHLGFEIWEGEGDSAKVIGFTHNNTFLDTTQYQVGYAPVYTVVAYDRALACSGKSASATLDARNTVCKIGEKSYSTLYDAFVESRSNDTIVVVADSFVSGLVVPSGKTLTIKTDGKPHTLFRGGAETLFRVEAGAELFLVGGENAELVLDGKSYEQEFPIVYTEGRLEILQCELRNNHIRYGAKKAGGAIQAVSGNGAVLSVRNTKFLNNSSFYGGALSCSAGTEIEGCTFRENHAVEGGAIYINNVATTIRNSVFEQNIADMGGMNGVTPSGGAICVVNWYASVTAEDLTLRANSAVRGGALYFDSQNFNGKRVTFENNSATEEGGAVYVSRKAWTSNWNWNNLSLVESTVKGTVCEEGAALYLRSNSVLGLDLSENTGCKQTIAFVEGSFTLEGGDWSGPIFLSERANLSATKAFPTAHAVQVETEHSELDGVFISAKNFRGNSDAVGFTVTGGSIVYSEEKNALIFALKAVNVTYVIDGVAQPAHTYILGREFPVDCAITDETKYIVAWTAAGREYAPGETCIATEDMTFTAVLKDKAVVTYRYPRTDLADEVVYVLPGESISLPKLDVLRNAAFEKYDLKGWKQGDAADLLLPFATVTVEESTIFTAELVDKLRVDYYVKPYAEEGAPAMFAAEENRLISTQYYTFGELIRFVRWHDPTGEYVPADGVIDAYTTASGEEIDFERFTVTADLDLFAVVTSQPITVFYTYLINGGTESFEGITMPIDYVKHGDDYTISVANVPYGYHIEKLELWTADGIINEFASREEIEGFRIEHADEFFYGITVYMECNAYEVSYKYNDNDDDPNNYTETKKFGDVLTLREPESLPEGYHFNSYQRGKKVLEMNDEGMYVETDAFLDVKFDDEGKIEVEITEDTIINIVVYIESQETLPDDPVDPNPGGEDPVDPNPGGNDPVDPNPGGTDPVDPNPGGNDPVDPNPGGTDPVDPNPGGTDPVDPNPGENDPAKPDPGPVVVKKKGCFGSVVGYGSAALAGCALAALGMVLFVRRRRDR